MLSLCVMFWQWLVEWRFPLHRREANPDFAPAVTLLKPIKGRDSATDDCLRSWFTQNYAGAIEILFGVASDEGPACEMVRDLLVEFPGADAHLVVCGPLAGANAKVSKLIELERLAKHGILVISDADVRVPADFLANALAPLHSPDTGLANCFYCLSNPTTLAKRWQAVAINADFSSPGLQSGRRKPRDSALRAGEATH